MSERLKPSLTSLYAAKNITRQANHFENALILDAIKDFGGNLARVDHSAGFENSEMLRDTALSNPTASVISCTIISPDESRQ